MSSASWMGQMALRDSRRNRGRLLLFVSSIILGIAALVAIHSFGISLQRQIDAEARELLGADLELESRQPFADSLTRYVDSLGWTTAREISFASMVQFGDSGGARLVNVRALSQGFPFYGEMETDPPGMARRFVSESAALADAALMLQYNVSPGDTLWVGSLKLPVAAGLRKVPGQSGIAGTVAPPVFIPLPLAEATDLLQRGSRVQYRMYLRYPDNLDAETAGNLLKPRLEAAGLRYTDVAERRQDLGDAYQNLAGFLNLIAFVALLLGCLGVASSVHIYMREKQRQVALLRCVGASGRVSLGIYLLQILAVGAAGAAIGALLGGVFQWLLPGLLRDLLPLEVTPHFSWRSVLGGFLVGVIITLLFSLPSLLSVRRVSPLQALRTGDEAMPADGWRYAVWLAIGLFVAAFAWWLTGNLREALFFTGGLAAALGLLAALAAGIRWVVRRYMPTGGRFEWRQALANLYRPNNQTQVLIMTIGLGTALLATLILSQRLLLDKVRLSSAAANRPNMVVFDIQDHQVDSLRGLTQEYGLPVLSTVPIVTMRLHSLKGKPVDDWLADSTHDIRRFWLDREYRVTYRDSLIDSETLTAGVWRGRVANPSDSIFISLDQGMAADMRLSLGDELVFNVQGALIPAYVGSLRKVDFQRVQTNFLVLFPAGVLEQAPKFHVLLSRFDSIPQSAAYQQALVRRFPNVSVIDLNLVLETIDEVLSKVAFVIRFMAFFSILTGLIVLIGSVRTSRFQRVQESVLLRTLGADRRQIIRINLLEYLVLGSIAALTGILIALAFGLALAKFSFNAVLLPSPLHLLGVYLAITGITVLLGMTQTGALLRKPPLEVLRQE